jgi:hypothetical protein
MELEDFSILALFERHMFVCQNVRPEGAPRRSCTTDGKSELLPQLQQFAKAAADRSDGQGAHQQGWLPRPVRTWPNGGGLPGSVWYGHVLPRMRKRLLPSTWLAEGPSSGCGWLMNASTPRAARTVTNKAAYRGLLQAFRPQPDMKWIRRRRMYRPRSNAVS